MRISDWGADVCSSDLEANPRAAKIGSVTNAIVESLEETPELFPFKSKGILIGTSSYEALQRNRFELTFDNPESEGILDGGHNMLAIGVHMLAAVTDERELGSISLWEEMTEDRKSTSLTSSH